MRKFGCHLKEKKMKNTPACNQLALSLKSNINIPLLFVKNIYKLSVLLALLLTLLQLTDLIISLFARQWQGFDNL